MRLISLFTLFLTACSTAYGQLNTQVNGDLTDECLASFVQLEEAFIKDEASKGFNPFDSGDDIAQMRMLIDMVFILSSLLTVYCLTSIGTRFSRM